MYVTVYTQTFDLSRITANVTKQPFNSEFSFVSDGSVEIGHIVQDERHLRDPKLSGGFEVFWIGIVEPGNSVAGARMSCRGRPLISRGVVCVPPS